GADILRDELVRAAIDRACLADPLPTDAASFEARVADARTRLNLVGQELARLLAEVLGEHAALKPRMGAARAHRAALEDIEAQIADLLPKRFITQTPATQLRHLPRYLKAIGLRLEKLRADPARDAQRLAEIAPLLKRWRQIVSQRRGQRD